MEYMWRTTTSNRRRNDNGETPEPPLPPQQQVREIHIPYDETSHAVTATNPPPPLRYSHQNDDDDNDDIHTGCSSGGDDDDDDNNTPRNDKDIESGISSSSSSSSSCTTPIIIDDDDPRRHDPTVVVVVPSPRRRKSSSRPQHVLVSDSGYDTNSSTTASSSRSSSSSSSRNSNNSSSSTTKPDRNALPSNNNNDDPAAVTFSWWRRQRRCHHHHHHHPLSMMQPWSITWWIRMIGSAPYCRRHGQSPLLISEWVAALWSGRYPRWRLFGTTTTTTSSQRQCRQDDRIRSSIIFRPIQPKDQEQIQMLHEQWFPVKYTKEFYDDLVYERMASTGDPLFTCVGTIPSSLLGLAPSSSLLPPHSDGWACSSHEEEEEEDPQVIVAGVVGSFLNASTLSGQLQKLLITNPQQCTKVFYIMTVGTAVRHQGIGSMLIEKCIDQVLQDTSCGVLYLHVLTTNAAAIQMYEQLGFHRVMEIPNYYMIHHVPYNCYLYAQYYHGNRGHVSSSSWLTVAGRAVRDYYCRRRRRHAVSRVVLEEETRPISQSEEYHGSDQ